VSGAAGEPGYTTSGLTSASGGLVNPGAIPEALRAEHRWVVWREELVGGRLTKVPYQAFNPGAKASSTDRSTWAAILRALANEERLLIALWLAGSTCSVRELEQVTGMTQSLVSYHLRELREARLVTSTASGRSNRYRPASVDLDQLAGLIDRLHVEAPATA
jgi:DNA-binding transcriptional ArsR family regulator